MKKNLLFLLLLLIIAVYYSYPEILTKRPQSVHAWRQSDCASIALNYAEEGMRFFSPEVHNLTSDNGQSGKAATSEVPWLYFLVAGLYRIFGYHEFIFRLLNTLIFLTGLFSLFRLGMERFRDFFWAASVPIFLFASPVIAYYANNYISNTPALGFTLMGWYFFFRYLEGTKRKMLIISMIFFFLAASLKITALLSLLALTAVFFLEKVLKLPFRKEKDLFYHTGLFISLLIPVLLLIIAWIDYASTYNRIHDCTYFSTVTFPIWDLESQTISNVMESVRKVWLDQYFHPSVYFMLALMLVFVFFRYRQSDKFLLWAVIFLTLGISAYIILQFWTFRDHDYYTINLFILPVFIYLTFLSSLRRAFPRAFSSVLLKSFFFLFLLFNIFHTQKNIRERYRGHYMDSTRKITDFYTISPYLREIGIEKRDTVISIAGNSHVTLYLMNLRGWTEHADARFGRGTEVIYNRDSAGIARSMERGARYMMVNGISQLRTKPYLRDFAFHLKGRYGEVLIFDLRAKEKNFRLSDPELEFTLICDAEKVDEDGYFTGDPDTVLFEYGNLQTSKTSFSGDHSIALHETAPFGMTYVLPPAANGEFYRFTVWKKGPAGRGTIVISGEVPEEFYTSEYKVIEERPDGWTQIRSEVTITNVTEGKQLKMYLYNPTADTVYFDDLAISKYSGFFRKDEK